MAQFDLATAFLEGKGVPQDSLEALKWCRIANNNNNKKKSEI